MFLHKFVVICLLQLLAGSMSAQLSSDEFKNIVKQKIEDFHFHSKTIGNRGVSAFRKETAIISALELFIGKGEPFEYTDDFGNRRCHEPVKMHISDKGRKFPPRLMATYLKNLKKLPYADVIIEAADVVRIDNIFETGVGKYKAVAYFIQRFCRYNREGKLIFSDVTENKVKICVEKEMIPLPDGTEKVFWPVYLGDIYALSTHYE